MQESVHLSAGSSLKSGEEAEMQQLEQEREQEFMKTPKTNQFEQEAVGQDAEEQKMQRGVPKGRT